MDNRPAYDADLVSLGHELARLRKERDWSIDVLAGQSGVGRLTIIAAENGKRALRVTTLYSLVTALGGDIGEVAGMLKNPQHERTRTARRSDGPQG